MGVGRGKEIEMIFAYLIGAFALFFGVQEASPLLILGGVLIIILTRVEDNSRMPESTWDRSYPITDDPNDMPDSTWRE